MLLLVILSFLLQAHNGVVGAPQPLTTSTSSREEVKSNAITRYGYSISITPPSIKELPISFDMKDFVREEVESFSQKVSSSIEKLEELEEEAKEKNFVVPLRFIESSLRSAKDLRLLFNVEKKKVEKMLKKNKLTHEDLTLLKNLRLLGDRIELLYLNSKNYYRSTTHFVPFKVILLK